jgi:LPXTG-motif cell wall-anchored protein
MISPRRRRASAALAVLALGAAGLLVASPAAAADPLDLSTPNVEWSSVRDDAAYIEDARALYQDYRGSGLSIYGFTDDAFDGFLEAQGDSAPGTSQTLVTLGATSLPLVVTPVSSTTVGGLTTLVASGTVNFGDGNTLSLTRTLEIQGSFARWSWDVTAVTGSPATAYTISEIGNLGSDEDSTFIPDGPNRLVSYEDGGSDMIIGYSFANAAYSVADFDDSVSVSFTADQDAVLTVAVIDYDPCSFDAALAGMQSAVATLAADFGDTLDSFYADDCLTVESPAAITGATDQRLDIIESDSLENNWDYIFPGSISDPEDGLAMVVLSAPAGLSFSLVADDPANDEPQVRMTGTPTASGEVTLLFYYFDGDNYNPLVATFDVSVELAATGTSEVAPVALGAAAALLGAGALLLVLRRRLGQR